jgi:hypothetical protein
MNPVVTSFVQHGCGKICDGERLLLSLKKEEAWLEER